MARQPDTTSNVEGNTAARLLRGAMRDSSPKVTATIGKVGSMAARLTHKAAVGRRAHPGISHSSGRPLRSQANALSCIQGPSTTSPTVAAKDSCNPTSNTTYGLGRASSNSASPRELRLSARRRSSCPASSTRHITPERTTDGVMPVSSIKGTTTPAAPSAAHRRGTRRKRSSPSTAWARIAMCSPETASRWDSPACRNPNFTSGDSAVLSPVHMAVTSAPSSPGSRRRMESLNRSRISATPASSGFFAGVSIVSPSGPYTVKEPLSCAPSAFSPLRAGRACSSISPEIRSYSAGMALSLPTDSAITVPLGTPSASALTEQTRSLILTTCPVTVCTVPDSAASGRTVSVSVPAKAKKAAAPVSNTAVTAARRRRAGNSSAPASSSRQTTPSQREVFSPASAATSSPAA